MDLGDHRPSDHHHEVGLGDDVVHEPRVEAAQSTNTSAPSDDNTPGSTPRSAARAAPA